jgi:UDP-N-acetylglucosamine 4,6-dehydratase/5-epimerase
LKQKNNQNQAIKKLLKNKIVLITGGAGSVGVELTKKLLEFQVKQIRILDINEHALFNINRILRDKRIRTLFGTINNPDRVEFASINVDIIIHLAALKNIEITEFNALDTIETNVDGTVNMIKMAIKNEPSLFLNISTDKVAASSTLYGATKQIGERLTQWAATHIQTTKFASVRFGNVIETRGNVFEVWREESSKNKPLSITHPNMKRYFWHIDEAVDFILEALVNMKQGEVFIPKMKLFKVKELASKISKKHKIIGLRPGEKLEELLITEDEKEMAIEKKKMWVLKSKF